MARLHDCSENLLNLLGLNLAKLDACAIVRVDGFGSVSARELLEILVYQELFGTAAGHRAFGRFLNVPEFKPNSLGGFETQS